MHVTAIIAAGGRGLRLGGAVPKQLLAVGGRPILERSVAAFLSHAEIDDVIVALPRDLADAPPAYLGNARIVAGGERRQDSVANAFRAVDRASDVIVIHDAARPFASAELISRTIAVAAEDGAAVAALQARDTVKRIASPETSGARTALSDVRPSDVRPSDVRPSDVRPSDVVSGFSRTVSDFNRTVIETLPRETIYLAQTPQAFRRDVLAAALAIADAATDEAALAEKAGHRVRIVEGEATNIKITTADDLPLAEAIAAMRNAERGMRNTEDGMRNAENGMLNTEGGLSHSALPARTGRAGTGYDLHRLVEGRSLVLAGVTIPSDRGALGHSDADVVCHAATDAILGAASLGDIGRHFPDSDARWKDASSIDLLRRAVALVAEQGLEVGNVDVTVILERPKIKDYVEAMRAAVAGAIGIDVSRVSIKGKTNEGVDAIGRGEAIAAQAVALVRRRS